MPKDKETIIVRATTGKIYRGKDTYPNKFGGPPSRKWDIYINAPENPDIKRVGWFMEEDAEPFVKEGDEAYFTLSWKDGETTNQKTGELHSVRFFNVEGVQKVDGAPMPASVSPPPPSTPKSDSYPIGSCPHCGGPIAMEFHRA